MRAYELTDYLRALEERLLQSAVRKAASAVAGLLADGFWEFGSSGRIYSKAEVIALLQREESVRLSLMDFEVKLLSASLALVTYRALRETPDGEPVQSWRSSLWELRDGRWQMLFYQGTKIPAG